MKNHLSWRLVALTLGAFALVWLALMVATSTKDSTPLEALARMFSGSLGTRVGLANTLREFTPLLLTGTAVYIALRAGLFNIGADGQFIVGGAAGVWAALAFPNAFGILAALVLGALAGAAWAWPAAWIKAHRGGHEVITTIMLNNIAYLVTLMLANGPLKDPDKQSPTTAFIADSAKIPPLVEAGRSSLSWALPLGIIVALGLWQWLSRTVGGYEVKAVGEGPKAAEAAGVKIKSVMTRAMLASGGTAGLAGALQVLASSHRFYKGFSPGYGFDALGVALLAGPSPGALVPSAFLFAVISQGAKAVSFLGIPRGLSGILLGLLIIVFAAWRSYRRPARG